MKLLDNARIIISYLHKSDHLTPGVASVPDNCGLP